MSLRGILLPSWLFRGMQCLHVPGYLTIFSGSEESLSVGELVSLALWVINPWHCVRRLSC